MTTEIEYERPPTEEEVEKDRIKERRRKEALDRRPYLATRCPGCKATIRVYDDMDPDAAIEEFIATGKCVWMKDNDPERYASISKSYYERLKANSK